jgi:hypothetical protein
MLLLGWDWFYSLRCASFSLLCETPQTHPPCILAVLWRQNECTIKMACNDNHNNSNTMPHQKPHLSKPKNSKMHSPLPLFTMNQFRKPGGDRKTVAYAVNYEPSLVDRFFASSPSVMGNGGEFPVGFYAVPVPIFESYDSYQYLDP